MEIVWFNNNVVNNNKVGKCVLGAYFVKESLHLQKLSCYSAVKLFLKNSDICDHNPPTSQTDRQTDDTQSQDSALHCSASRRKNGPDFGWP